MRHSAAWFAAGVVVLLAGGFLTGCGSEPVLVIGQPTTGNIPPTLEIINPSTNLTLNQGDRFDIGWSDSDRDSAAMISFSLINVDTGLPVLLVSNIPENDQQAPDSFNVATSFVPIGTYNLQGTISDGVNAPVTAYALQEASTSRVLINIGEPGTIPSNVPPRVAVVAPTFNLGLAQDDTLEVRTQPTATFDANVPYDPDSETTLYILLDLDEDPANDDPRSPDYNTNPANGIIVLRETTIPAGTASTNSFQIAIDLTEVPPRDDGSPYYVRATILDDSNPAVHSYAKGTINIVRSATGVVDLSRIGKTLAGARFQGFNPGSRLGTRMTTVTDFDADGVDDFVLVAQYGNPRNFGNIGEAYLIYGMDRLRFGGDINVNSVSSDVSGVIFEGPPNRLQNLHTDPLAKPRGIVGASYVPDLSGDNRPELLFGLPMVDGIFQHRDDDPGDDPSAVPVRITVREGLVQRTLYGKPDTTIDDDFIGTLDTYVDRAFPSNSFGTQTLLRWSYNATTVQDDQVSLIGFDSAAIRQLFTTLTVDNIKELKVTLTLVTPDLFEAFPLLVSFSEDSTFANFGQDGPTAGVDYTDQPLTRTNRSVDVTETFTAWLAGTLPVVNPSWLIRQVRTAAAGLAGSSEGSLGGRPILTITYNEEGGSSYGCYPDSRGNNYATRANFPADGVLVDSSLEACGVVMVVNSENRDLLGRVNVTRLDNTSMALELVGQDAVGGDLGPSFRNFVFGVDSQVGAAIQHLAGDPATSLGRGVRIQGGWWDYVNNGNYGEADPRTDYFGEHVASIPDVNNDGAPDVVMSAPRNELYMSLIRTSVSGGPDRRILASTAYTGSILVTSGHDFSTNPLWKDTHATVTIPAGPTVGNCTGSPPELRDSGIPAIRFEIFAEDINDYLGGAEYAGDVNLDGIPDIVCGAPLNDNPNGTVDAGAVYVIYIRTPIGNISLRDLDDPARRPPALRIRGERAGDKLGSGQTSGLDINGDRVADVFIGSPTVDFPGVDVPLCGDVDGNGVADPGELNLTEFNACHDAVGDEVFLDDPCKPYDFDNDRDIDDEDRNVFDCLVGGFQDCCPVDNGFVGVVFGNVNLDGDRTLSQIATSDLPGLKFYGATAGDRAGLEVASAGDFNRDGYGDLLIAAPGVRFTDGNGRQRMGVAYLIFGGVYLNGNHTFSLAQVGTADLPGMIFWSPFVTGRPNEAPIEHVAGLGDINLDGFGDIGIGIPRADFVDSALPQDPNDPGTDPNIGRRPDDGNVYIIYGNNTTGS